MVFRARRPAALVVPLAAITEVAGVLSLLNGATIGWFICAAPAFALVTTGLILRPSIELTREGVLQRQYPFSTLTERANVLIFPNLSAGNIAYKLLNHLGGATAIGPILVGMRLPVHVLEEGAEVQDIVNMAAVAVIDAQQHAAGTR